MGSYKNLIKPLSGLLYEIYLWKIMGVLKGYYKYYQPAKIAKACPYFVEDFEDYLERYFMTWPSNLDVLTGV